MMDVEETAAAADAIVRAVLAGHIGGVSAMAHMETVAAVEQLHADPGLLYAVLRHVARTAVLLASTVAGAVTGNQADELVGTAIRSAVDASRC